MENEVVEKLLDLNKAFYSKFAATFADSRSRPQPGYQKLLGYLPANLERVLDIGCGNGRFGAFLRDHNLTFQYTGVDFTRALLLLAEENVVGTFYERDIGRPGFLHDLGRFDLIVCLSTMQHIPGRLNRVNFLRETREHLAPNGHIFLANWQFLDSSRQRRKIRSWQTTGLSEKDVEPSDYLLSWQRDGAGLRYVALVDAEATAALAASAGLRIIEQYRSDGREGNLNLYTVMTPDSGSIFPPR